MLLAIASDHAGYDLKQALLPELYAQGFEVTDLGTHGHDPVDYPDYAEAIGQAVTTGQAARGILICGSGVGASIAASKIPGVRAAVCHDTYSARQGVEHDRMNILVLGARVVGTELALELVRSFLGARFAKGEERHLRRLRKIEAIERRYGAPTPPYQTGPTPK
jgi:ribose 5-phosphate isomerase B